MDAEYRALARKRHLDAKYKQDEEEARRLVERQLIEAKQKEQIRATEWRLYQEKTLTEQGFREEDVEKLVKSETFEDCMNWNPSNWQGDLLSTAFRLEVPEPEDTDSLDIINGTHPYAVGYNLQDVMLSHDLSGFSAQQTRALLGLPHDAWQKASKQWNMVNPFPLQPLNPWKEYRVDVNPLPVTEEVGNQLFGISTKTHDLRGSGTILVPPNILHYIQHELKDDYWNGQHPFLVIQLLFRDKYQDYWHTDFAVVPIGEGTAQPNRLFISSAITARTGIVQNDAVHARLITLLPIRGADRGVGVQLEYCPIYVAGQTSDPSDSTEAASKEMEQRLTKELEKQYMLVKGQWICLTDNREHVWMYKVKKLWSVQGRPVQVASIYGAHVAIEIVVPPDVTPNNFFDVLSTWTK